LQPAHPNGDTKLGLADFGSRASPERAPERGADHAESPRRLISQDGLHVRSSRPPRAELTQEESLRERALLALVSSARHELRSPLQSIQGFADLLASGSYGTLGGDQQVFVEHIIQGSADLSRALDACFELFQAEALHIPTEPLPASLRRLVEEALSIAESNKRSRFETRLSELDPELTVEIDLHDFSKAVEAVITTLSPLARGRIVVSASAREGEAEVTFAVTEEPRTLRALHELPRRGVSARALLWLRLAASLLARSDSRLETCESYDKVRILLPA
jgi:signal transduction histidine kinase